MILRSLLIEATPYNTNKPYNTLRHTEYVCAYICMCAYIYMYGVATIIRLLKIIVHVCRILSLL